MSRLDDLKKQNPQLDVSLIDIIASLDPTSTYKYLGFMLKMIKIEIEEMGGNVKKIIGQAILDEEYIDHIKRFESHCSVNRMKNPDISSYKSLDDVIFAVNTSDQLLKQKESEKQVIKIYDTDEYLVLLPLTFEASKTYGSNTKWCVTQEQHWKSYQWIYKLIFIINKKNGTKYAISRKYDDQTKIQAWLSDDKEISPLLLKLSPEVTVVVLNELQKNKYETEISVLKEDAIITDDGVIVPFDRVDKTLLKNFINRFGPSISKDFKKKIETRFNDLGINGDGFQKYFNNSESLKNSPQLSGIPIGNDPLILNEMNMSNDRVDRIQQLMMTNQRVSDIRRSD